MRMVGLGAVSAAATAFTLAAVLAAHQGASTPAAKPLVPTAANSIAAQPDVFYGQLVTLLASVDRILSATTFVVDQDPKGSGKGEVLVVVGSLSEALTVN